MLEGFLASSALEAARKGRRTGLGFAPWVNLARYTRDPLSFYAKSAATGRAVDRIELGPFTTYAVYHPALIETVLSSQARSFRKDRVTRALDQILGDGLITAGGALWQKNRKALQPAFHGRLMAGYAKVFVTRAREQIAQWPAGEPINLHQRINHLTLRIVCETLFGTQLGDRVTIVEEALTLWLRHFSSPMVLLKPKAPLWPSPFYHRLKAATERLEGLLSDLIDESVRRPDPSALLSAIIAEGERSGEGLDRKWVRDEIVTLLMAGHETTANNLSWTAWLLATHPEAQKKAAAEAAALDSGDDGAQAQTSLQRMSCVQSVLLEGLRLYPPVWVLTRQAVEPVRLGSTDLDTEAHVSIPLYAIHRNPAVFPEPNVFRPERWLEEGFVERLPRFTYMPFGGGQRICIGKDFAMLESVAIIAALLRRFEVQPLAGFTPKTQPSVSLRPKEGMWFTLKRR